jgi:hypothetical protein
MYFDPIRPISPADRSVKPVDLTILTPLEREQERQRRERERQRRARDLKHPQDARETPQDRPDEPNSGIDVRV